MKRPTQIRCDTFTSSGTLCRVSARKDHVFSTDVKIAKSFDGHIRKFTPNDPYFGQDRGTPAVGFAHIPTPIRIDIDDLVINKSIEKMSFKPNSAVNRVEVSGKQRATILPYLCDDRVYKNKNFKVVQTVTPTYVDSAGQAVVMNDARPFRYHPTVNSMLMLRPRSVIDLDPVP